jgi:aspartate/tyrosine/aromatic aminotransferase
MEMAPPDPILGLVEAFNKDENPNKISLGAGVYKDDNNKTPLLSAVQQAEAALLNANPNGAYLPIPGAPEYATKVQELLFGAGHEIIESGRAGTAHTPGGTGALRVAGDFIHTMLPNATLWVSDPTWANHGGIFTAANVPMKKYPYFNAETNSLRFDEMLGALKEATPGDVVLLHGCCHNPTGIDPTPDQWATLATFIRDKNLLPLIDFAYQGFGAGIEEDATGLRAFCQPGQPLLTCSSFSKNFGLYRERVGAFTLVAENADAKAKAFSHVKLTIRTNYSNPPFHGGAIVTQILSDPALRAEWEKELAQMRDRVNQMRKLFVETLANVGVQRDFNFITQQKGMFSFSGLTKEQVATLKEKHAIYIVGSGRINVAGMTEQNIETLCKAIADVL